MKISVSSSPAGDGFTCQVEVGEGRSVSHHTVHVARRDLERWAHGRTAEELVRRSFEFLLEREPKESILREFGLSVIPRYFPEFSESMGSGQHPST